MTENSLGRQNRRDFFGNLLGWSGIAGVVLAGWLMGGRKVLSRAAEICTGGGLCRSCRGFPHCHLPAALSAKAGGMKKAGAPKGPPLDRHVS